MSVRLSSSLSRWATLLVVLSAGRAQAQVVTPTGSIDWSNPAGWVTGHIPGGTETPQLSTGTITVTGSFSVGNINLFGGALTNIGTGNGALTITSTGSEWRSTTLNSSTGGNLSLTIGSSANLLISTGADHDFNATAIANSGTVTWTAGHIYSSNGGTFTNSGTFNDQNLSSYTINNPSLGGTAGTFVFSNTGTYNRTVTGTTTISTTFNNTGNVNVSGGGRLTLNGGGTSSGAFNVSGSGSDLVIGGNYSLTDGAALNGLVRFTSGTLTATGNITVSGATFEAGNLQGTQTFTGGSLTWSGGDWNAASAGSTTTIGTGATLLLSGGNNHNYNFRNVTNNGTVTWTSGFVGGGNGSVFTNAGTFNDNNPGSNSSFLAPGSFGFGGSATFTNTGTYIRDAAGTTSSFVIPFNNLNNGSVQVKNGNLRFQAGGSLDSTASIAAAAGTNVYFDNGFTIQNGASLTGLNGGSGNFFLTGGTLALTGTLNAANFTQTAGTLSGTNTLNGTFTWSGGDWNATSAGSSTTINTGATLLLNGGSNHNYNFRNVTNNGTITWTSGYIGGGNGSVFTNAGTFNDNNPGSNSSFLAPGSFGFGGTASFTNTGTYIRDAAASTSSFAIPFNNLNNGLVQVKNGNLRFQAGGSLGSNASIAAAAGTNVYFDNGFTIQNGASLTGLNAGSGNFFLTGGTLALTGTLNAVNFTQTGGTLSGTHTLNGSFTWNGGDWNDTSAGATTTIGTGATLLLAGGNNHNYNFRNVTNNGTVTWTSGYIGGGNGSVFTNAGTFNDNNPGSNSSFLAPGSFGFGGTASFTNTGTYIRDAAATTSSFAIPFNNLNNGVVQVKNGDLRFQAGGSLDSTASIAAAAGTNVYFDNGFTIQNGASLTGLNGGTGNYFLTGGTLALTGTLNVSNFIQNGGTLAGTNALSGAFIWNNGDWSSAGTTIINNGATLTLAGGNNHTYNFHSITNNGTVTWTSGYVGGGNGSVFTNNGTFHDQNAGSNSSFLAPGSFGFGGSASFTNNGTYTRDVGSTTSFAIPFNNNGTLNLAIGAGNAVGDIQLNAGGTMSATSIVNGAAGTHLYFNSNYTLLDGAQFLGLGSFTQISSTLTIDGTLLASAFHWSGGDWNGPAVANGASLPTTTIGATTTLLLDGGNNHTYNYRNVTNSGTVTWTSGYIGGGNGSVFTNNGTFNDNNPGSNSAFLAPGSFGFGGTASFVNNGTYTRNVGSTTSFNVPFNNNGTLNLAIGAGNVVGDIQLNGGGTMSATSIVNAAAGTHLYFSSNYTLLSGAQLLGLGSYIQNGGTLTIDGTLLATAFHWSGGDWNGPAVANGASLPTTTIGATTTLLLDGGNNHTYNYRNITNNGTVTWTSGYIGGGNGSAFLNAGTFNDQNPGSNASFLTPGNFGFGGTSSFTNNGTYNKTASGTTTFAIPFTNNNGAIYVSNGALRFSSSFLQNSGTISVSNGSSIQFDNGLNLAAGYLVGHGTIIGNVSSSQIISPSYQTGQGPGQLNITGNLTLQSTSSLIFQLGGATQGSGYDFLNVSGTASLNGTLSLTMSNGFNLTANPASTFTILNSSALSGTFTNVPTSGMRLNSIDGLGSFQVNFTSTSVTLSNYIPIPEPSTWTLLGLGLAPLALIGRRRPRR